MVWLKKQKIGFSFHDHKQEGISAAKIKEWLAKEKLENIFNKRSTTWRELPGSVQNEVKDRSAAIKIMMEHNSIIKRPIIEYSNRIIVGFNEEEYKRALK